MIATNNIGVLAKAELIPAQFHTPWCEEIGIHTPVDIVDFYYSRDTIRDEIEMKTSYLGKFRRTEEASHLLDLIAMTVDEQDLFENLLKTAMAEVYDTIAVAAREIPNGCKWEDSYIPEEGEIDSSNTIHYILALNSNFDKNMITPLDIAIKDALTADVIYKWLSYAYKDEAENYMAQYAAALQQIRDRLGSRKHLIHTHQHFF